MKSKKKKSNFANWLFSHCAKAKSPLYQNIRKQSHKTQSDQLIWSDLTVVVVRSHLTKKLMSLKSQVCLIALTKSMLVAILRSAVDEGPQPPLQLNLCSNASTHRSTGTSLIWCILSLLAADLALASFGWHPHMTLRSGLFQCVWHGYHKNLCLSVGSDSSRVKRVQVCSCWR